MTPAAAACAYPAEGTGGDTICAALSDQSMLWAITTAGSDKTGICFEQRAYVLNILNGNVKDENYFGIVYTIDDGDDWTSEATWRKANPNYGISVEADHLELQCRKAIQSPASKASFMTKHLNVWIQTRLPRLDCLVAFVGICTQLANAKVARAADNYRCG